MMSNTTRVEIYAASIKSLDQKFELEIEMSKIDKPEPMKHIREIQTSKRRKIRRS